MHHHIPGGLANDAIHRQIKDVLDLPHGILRGGIEHSVDVPNLRNGGVGRCNLVGHNLGDTDVRADVTQTEGDAGIGVLDVLNGSVVYNF